MTAFDRALAVRALAYGGLGSALALAVMLLTEEPSSTWPQRLARLCLFVPATAALASALSLAQARARGELVALAALGASPLRVARGPSLVAWALGALAVALVASPAADVSSLFPALRAQAHFRADTLGFSDLRHGVRVDPHGALHWLASSVEPQLRAQRGLEAALVTGSLSLVLPLWVSAELGVAVRVLGAALALGLVLVLLHAVAASRLGAPWLMSSALPLAFQALIGHRRRACP
ncbi:MAG TPA: hypothetical protein VK524_14325 [Polyangiaceae bacterium]|nr:hypothetical protein [Polyangiaceae bacterium]